LVYVGLAKEGAPQENVKLLADLLSGLHTFIILRFLQIGPHMVAVTDQSAINVMIVFIKLRHPLKVLINLLKRVF
jgi:hypothetical protein